jgi:hypothetical protein
LKQTYGVDLAQAAIGAILFVAGSHCRQVFVTFLVNGKEIPMSHNKYPKSGLDRLRHSATLRAAGAILALSTAVAACGTAGTPGQAAKGGKSGTPVATRTSTPKPTTSPTESGQPGSKGLPMSEQCAADSKILDTAFQLGSGAAESSCVILATSDTWGSPVIKWTLPDGTIIAVDKEAPLFKPVFNQWAGTSGDVTFSADGQSGVIDHNGQEDLVMTLPDGTYGEINATSQTAGPGTYDTQLKAAAGLLFNFNGINPYSTPEPTQ